MTLRIREGEQLPSVGLRATDGYLLNLRSFVTKRPVVILFFGAATMQGAAAERGLACIRALAAGQRRLEEAGIAAVAVSCDSERQQAEFVAAHDLPILLMSDERRTAAEILGLPMTSEGDNHNVARPVMLAVDRDGAVRSVFDDVEPQLLIDQAIAALSEPIGEPAAGPVAAPVEDAASPS